MKIWILTMVIAFLTACSADAPFIQQERTAMDKDTFYLVEIDAYDPIATSPVTLRFTSAAKGFTTASGDTPANTYYAPNLTQPGFMQRTCFGNGTTGGASQDTYGVITLANSTGTWDHILRYAYGRDFRVRVGKSGAAYPLGFPIIMTGIVEQPEAKLIEISFTIRDKQSLFDKPVQPLKYLGTNALPDGVEGVLTDIKDHIKPLLLGSATNMTPVCVNTSKLIYQYSTVAPDASGGMLVYDRGVGVVAGQSTAGGSQAEYTSQADMLARAPADGTWLPWYAGGMFRLGSSPAGILTVLTAGIDIPIKDMITAIVASPGPGGLTTDFSAGNIGTELAGATDPITHVRSGLRGGIYINTDRTIKDVLDEICNSAGAWWGFDRLGNFQSHQLQDPSGLTSVADINISNILSIEKNSTKDTGNGLPIWKVSLGSGRNYTIMNPSDLAGSVSISDRTLLGLEYYYFDVSDSSILTAFPTAQILTKNTVLGAGATATNNEVTRLLNLYKIPRDRFDITVKLDVPLAQAVDLGSVVTVTYPRFNLATGKKMIIIGIKPDFRRNIFVLTVWG